jgi:penicillin-binding protein 1C
VDKNADGRDKPGHDGVRGRGLRALSALAITLILAIVGFVAWVYSLGPLPLDEARQVSTTIVDRNGKLLRAYAMADGRWRLPVDAKTSVDPTYLKLLLAYEDQRFYAHNGLDPLALARAALQLGTRGHIVSGGSTITMQLARLMEPRRQRSLHAKLRQIVRAIELERTLSKEQILDLYLALAPYGGNLEGIRAASIAYFGKEPKRLSLAEAALLVALPQSPETRRLDRYPDAARKARDRVLDRMVEEHVVSADDARQAKAVPVPKLRKPMPILAPHASDTALSTVKDTPVIKLTLDASLQKVLEPLARDRAIALGPNISVGIVVVDNESGDVLARVGSADYFDESRAGQVDMTRAVRSPGSTLKPFIYGLAFEDGFVHPDSLIDDRPVRFGSYAPENFDMTFQGTVPVRKALQLSLNVPAIVLLDRVGSSRLASRLRQAGGNLVLPKDETPGLAMGLGGVGVTLQDLVQLYAGFARLGTTKPLREVVTEQDDREPLRLLDQAAAGERCPQPDRVQDRDVLRLSRRLVGRLRWPYDHRRLGRPARRRPGSRPDRARRCRADPVRRLCQDRQDARPVAEGAQGNPGGGQRQAAAASEAVPPGRGAGAHRERAGAAHSVSAQRFADRCRSIRQPGERSHAGQSRRRCAAHDDHG